MSEIDHFMSTVTTTAATALAKTMQAMGEAVAARDGERVERLARSAACARFDDSEFLWHCAAHAFHAGRPESALKLMEMSIPVVAPFDRLSSMGEAALRCGDSLKALRYFQALFRDHPESPYAFERLQALRLSLLQKTLHENADLAFYAVEAIIETSRTASPALSARLSFAHKAAHGLLTVLPAAAVDGIHKEVRRRCGGQVSQGPFAGMTSPADDVYGFSASMMLGGYEPQLLPVWSAIIAGPYDRLLNIGAAEGYYAVGFARAAPRLDVVAWEIVECLHAPCRALAAQNGVGDRIRIFGRAEIEGLRQAAAAAERPVVIMDIEGAELDILTPEVIADLARCDFVIESHDCYRADITETLTARFADTHDCVVLEEGFADPDDYPALNGLPEIVRWPAVCEMRPYPIRWIVACSRAHSDSPLRALRRG